MDVIFSKVSGCRLFDNLTENEKASFLSRPSIVSKRFSKNSVILRAGDICRNICIVAGGKAVGEAVSDDGRAEEMAYFEEGGMFGDIIAMSESGESPVSVKALTDAEILFVPISEVLTEQKLTVNLARSVSKEYFSLRFRLSCLIKPTLRLKIMEYLYYASGGKTGVVFEIPFSQSGFADYLASSRASLTRELTILRKEGVIDYYGRNYKINRMV